MSRVPAQEHPDRYVRNGLTIDGPSEQRIEPLCRLFL